MTDDRKPVSGSAEVEQRMAVLFRHLHDAVPLGEAAIDAGISLRTARRWLTRYRADGPAGLARPTRPEAGKRTFPKELVELIEGMALLKPPPSIVTIHRRIAGIVSERRWRLPSYGSVRDIVRRIDPAMLTLAHEGAAAFRDKFELVHRHRAERPNAIWQADHTQLDILILDAGGRPVRPWLTTVLDDHSRVIAGYMVFLRAPSALNTSLALRQAIWRKADPAWPVCGIPDVLYVDHGSDFTSLHLEQAAADLRIRLIYSAVARPQGRGKIERLFRTINTELLAELPGNLPNGKPASPPRLTLPELDAAIGAYIVATYNVRRAPRDRRAAGGCVARRWLAVPDAGNTGGTGFAAGHGRQTSHRPPRRHPFRGAALLQPNACRLCRRAGDDPLRSVTIRYDPRDVGEVRMFHRNAFLCRAVSPDHAGLNITLKDVQAARIAYRRRLRSELGERKARVADYLPAILRPPGSGPARASTQQPALATPPEATRSKPRLRTYYKGE